jgi:hypothetical protein
MRLGYFRRLATHAPPARAAMVLVAAPHWRNARLRIVTLGRNPPDILAVQNCPDADVRDADDPGIDKSMQ